jgi:hypothetical protein
MPGGHHFVGISLRLVLPLVASNKGGADQREGCAKLGVSHGVTAARVGRLYRDSRTLGHR